MIPSFEIWATVPGHPDYEVSTFGRVRRMTPAPRGGSVCIGKPLKPANRGGSYPSYALSHNNKPTYKRAHQLVAEAFLGLRPSGSEVAHGDGDRSNNFVGNLRWATRLENHRDAVAHGTFIIGERHSNSKLTENDVLEIRRRAAAGETQADLMRAFGTSRANICLIVNHKAWAHL